MLMIVPCVIITHGFLLGGFFVLREAFSLTVRD